jgi:hypothetical protein
LNDILHALPDIKPFWGLPAENAQAPDIKKKTLEEIVTFV